VYHYVYYSYEEWGRGYIGVRSCNCLPEEDCSYFGSFFDKTFTPTEKIIIDKFESREQALQAEIDLHSFYQVHVNPQFANKAKQTSKKFDHGKHDEETKRKIGEGNRGLVRSEEVKLLWSKQRKGRKKAPFSEQHKANMGEAKRGENSPIKGRKWWNNGIDELLAYAPPDDTWVRGRSPALIKKCSEANKRQHEKRRSLGLPWPASNKP
jgi:hypothetical protein